MEHRNFKLRREGKTLMEKGIIKVLLIGNLERVEELWNELQESELVFDIPVIVLEDNGIAAETCMNNVECICLENIILLDIKSFDLFFVCSQFQNELRTVLAKLGVSEEKVFEDRNVRQLFMTADQRMKQMENEIYNRDQIHYLSPNVSVGAFTYGTPIIRVFRPQEKVVIGKFCSIADNVVIFGGGEHKTDWGTTYPFNVFLPDFSNIMGHPASKGDVVIGNDVWLASGCKIMSGVTIGDGAVIAANALVTKDIPPYSVVGGNPAKFLKRRFAPDVIKRFLEIKWWDWEYRDIYHAIPLIQSNAYEELFKYYDNIVVNKNEIMD